MQKNLDLKITELSATMVVTTNRTRVSFLEKVTDVKLALGGILVPTTFQVIELYMQYSDKVTEIPILCNRENPPMDLEDAEDEGTLDEFKFEDELLEKVEGYFTRKISNIKLFENP
ncbi:1836_t:CDS:2 [Cetraspora pellucida]|uniref:1836_t:CDS:1 n=1 Tax=Cetraspora pellucida TaxID=1433469 RepID=A0ACA9LUZ5_9GLOM|nr:1836_t:CDS:2 [Cetraspora pellucida]